MGVSWASALILEQMASFPERWWSVCVVGEPCCAVVWGKLLCGLAFEVLYSMGEVIESTSGFSGARTNLVLCQVVSVEESGLGWCFCFNRVDRTLGDMKLSTPERKPHSSP